MELKQKIYIVTTFVLLPPENLVTLGLLDAPEVLMVFYLSDCLFYTHLFIYVHITCVNNSCLNTSL